MYVLGIESTCDETAASIVKDGHIILSNIISSQADMHKEYGGVFPELACRSHIDMIIPIIDKAIKDAGITKDDIDLISVANGPGLIGAVLIGVNVAKGLSLAWNKPLVGINHIEAHLYAAMMQNLDTLAFPSLGVVISGGHTMLLKIDDVGKYTLLGSTIDDAVGEAFDKVASILDLGYPGGPAIEKLALNGNENAYDFKPSKVKDKPYSFSYSGLKTKVLYTVKGQSSNKNSPSIISEVEKKDIAASFQKTALLDIVHKSIAAAKEYNLKSIYLGGGVSNNKKIKDYFNNLSPDIPIFWPTNGLSLDNAAMIAGLAYQKHIKNNLENDFDMPAFARKPI